MRKCFATVLSRDVADPTWTKVSSEEEENTDKASPHAALGTRQPRDGDDDVFSQKDDASPLSGFVQMLDSLHPKAVIVCFQMDQMSDGTVKVEYEPEKFLFECPARDKTTDAAEVRCLSRCIVRVEKAQLPSRSFVFAPSEDEKHYFVDWFLATPEGVQWHFAPVRAFRGLRLRAESARGTLTGELMFEAFSDKKTTTPLVFPVTGFTPEGVHRLHMDCLLHIG